VKKADMGLPEIERLLEGFGGDLTWLALSGGEVTLVPHFPEVIDLARRHCPNLRLLTFTTNGLLPEKALELARHVVSRGFDLFVTVSLDGDEETHDRIRGVPGNHALAVRTLRLLREAGVQAHFGITLSDGNREFVRERFHRHERDIKAVTFIETQGIYRQKNSVDIDGIGKSLSIILSRYRVRSPGDLIEWIYLRLARAFLADGRKRMPISCDVLRTSVHVMPNGDVHPCMFLPALGSIRTAGLGDLLKSHAAREALARHRAAWSSSTTSTMPATLR
jgi:MoaA/NifB/PqqE/SkfB family radical SAM enzyme